MGLTKTTWAVTEDSFEGLLVRFDPDREKAGRKYEVTRRKLLEFFEARGSNTPDEHADETFDRVARRVAEGEIVNDINRYCYGVARLVWMEACRQLSKQPVELDENAPLRSTNGH